MTMIGPEELIALRRDGRRRTAATQDLPSNIAAAYGVAAATLICMARPVGAWKLGATTAGTRKTFSTDTIYFGGLLEDEMWCVADGAAPPAPLILRGEAEIAFRLARDIAADASATALFGEPAKLFDAWAPVIEAPYSCIENIPDAGLGALLADRCAAGALYMGALRTNIADAAIGATIEICIDGRSAASGDAKTSLLMPPVEAAMGFLAIAAQYGVSVKRGQWISTGGITPCIDLPFDQPIGLRFGGKDIFTIKVRAPALAAVS